MDQCLLLLQLPAFSPNRDWSYPGETKIIQREIFNPSLFNPPQVCFNCQAMLLRDNIFSHPCSPFKWNFASKLQLESYWSDKTGRMQAFPLVFSTPLPDFLQVFSMYKPSSTLYISVQNSTLQKMPGVSSWISVISFFLGTSQVHLCISIEEMGLSSLCLWQPDSSKLKTRLLNLCLFKLKSRTFWSSSEYAPKRRRQGF